MTVMLGYSFDPSLRATGIVRWRDGFPAEAVTVLGRSLFTMMDGIGNRLVSWEQQYGPPSWWAAERVYLGENPQTSLALAGLQDTLRYWFWSGYAKPPTEYLLTTAEIDDLCEIRWGKSIRRKAAVAAWAALTARAYGLDLGDGDQHKYDALAVGWAAKGLHGEAQAVERSVA